MSSGSIAQLYLRTLSRVPENVAYMVPEGKGHCSFTYAEGWDAILAKARGLDAIGLAPGDRVGLMAETGMDWATTDWACQCLGLVVVPVFPSLPADQAQYILQDAGARVAVVHDAKQAEKLAGSGTTPHDFAEVVALGAGSALTSELLRARAAGEPVSEVATIIYTSGTTGEPKGALLTHQGFISLCANIPGQLPVDENDVFLSWLPLAHVFERFAGHVLPVSLGATVAYAGSIVTLASDMQRVRPTVLLTVPRLLETLRTRILDGVKGQPPLRRRLFGWALAQGQARLRGEFAPLAPVLDAIVGRKIRDRLGGRLRFFVSGGAALPPDISRFYMGLGVSVLQGYGLTETTAATSCNHPDRNRPESAGQPIAGVEVMIAPDGEILVRGASVMQGYWNLPEATREAITPDGWFRTGDIGTLDEGYIRITDRKKDIIVLASGKNVAPQRVEAALKAGSHVAEAVVFGDGSDHCYALLVPDFERLATTLGLAAETPCATIVASEGAEAVLKKEVDAANATLADFERVRKFKLVPAPFSIETGELTPSMKVRRKVVRARYEEMLSQLH